MNVVRRKSAEACSSRAWIAAGPRWNRGSSSTTTASTPGSSANVPRASRSCSGLAEPRGVDHTGDRGRRRQQQPQPRLRVLRQVRGQEAGIAAPASRALARVAVVAEDRDAPAPRRRAGRPGGRPCPPAPAATPTRVTPVRAAPRVEPVAADPVAVEAVTGEQEHRQRRSPHGAGQRREVGDGVQADRRHRGPRVGCRERQQVARPDVGTEPRVHEGGDADPSRVQRREHPRRDGRRVADQPDGAGAGVPAQQGQVQAGRRVGVDQTEAAGPEHPDAGVPAEAAQRGDVHLGSGGTGGPGAPDIRAAGCRARRGHRPRHPRSCGQRPSPRPAPPRPPPGRRGPRQHPASSRPARAAGPARTG